MNRKRLLIISGYLLLAGMLPPLSARSQQAPQLGRDPVAAVVAAMTPAEKVNIVLGTGMKFAGLPASMQGPVVGITQDRVPGAAGTTFSIPRLGIPSIVVADGPAGLRIQPVRDSATGATYYCTAFPIGTLLASSWDTSLVSRVGLAMGNEVKEYGVDVLLAPALNNQRNPLGGRNFEYYSEDPLVSGKIAAAYVNGIQRNGVGTSIKHFALNNHEWNRNTINVIAGERTIREIYLRSFQWAITESSPWTVMSSYNKINGIYASENRALLTTILRNEWNFKGLVMTDWFGGADPVAQMKAGNDLLMPGTAGQQQALMAGLQDGSLNTAVLDTNVTRILNLILETPSFKKYPFTDKPDLKAHATVARMAAAEGMILLKNDQAVLPLKAGSRIAVFGNTSYAMITGGTGSGDVNEAYTISLIQGLTDAGFKRDAQLNKTYDLYVKEQIAGRPKPLNPFLLPPPLAEMDVMPELVDASAVENDLALITIGRNAGEFADRKVEGDFDLTQVEKDLINKVTAAYHKTGKKVIVVLNVGGVIETASWKSKPDAILLAWQPGQEAGHAVTDVLSGRVNPGGKLTMTFPISYNDVPSSAGFPGKVIVARDTNNPNPMSGDKAAEVVYTENIYTGYRYFDKDSVRTSYPFGFGLSYTRFSYSPVTIRQAGNGFQASVTVTNTGRVAGREIVQFYVSAPGKSIDKPKQELKAFGKTGLLRPGASETVAVKLDASLLSSFDPARSSWILEPGNYSIRASASSNQHTSDAAANTATEARFRVARELITEAVNPVLRPDPVNPGLR